MNSESIQPVAISVKGKNVPVPAVTVAGRTIIVTGRMLKLAAVQDEEWWVGDPLGDPERMVAGLRQSRLGADIFTFAQGPTEPQPKYSYPFEWDNAAIIRIDSYQKWWDKLSQESRRNVRLAAKRGVTVRVVAFDDELVRGIQAIYNEAPVRLGKPFWHFGKSLETIQAENSTYLDRSEFIGAFYEGQLIGFIKLVYVGEVGSIMQILSKMEHQDKRTTNALLNKAVEVCAAKKIPYLQYCKFVYGANESSSLTEFKRRNGFEQIRFPQYFIPLTVRGRLALKVGLHHGIKGCLPPAILRLGLQLRTQYYNFRENDSCPASSA